MVTRQGKVYGFLERLLDPADFALAALWASFFHFLPHGWRKIRYWKANAASYWISRNDSLFRSYASFIYFLGGVSFFGALGGAVLVGFTVWHYSGSLLYGLIAGAPLASILTLAPGVVDGVMERATGVTGDFALRAGTGYLHRCSNCGDDLHIGEYVVKKDEFGRGIGYICHHCGNVDVVVHLP
jgi:hypothetical protein